MDKIDFYLRKRAELSAIAESKELEAGLLCDELKGIEFFPEPFFCDDSQ